MRPSRLVPRRTLRTRSLSLQSDYLERRVELTVLMPPGYRLHLLRRYPVVLLNDGQDFTALRLRERIAHAYRAGELVPMLIVGIHANEARLREYGTSRRPDYAGRGDLADQHRKFVVGELLPLLDQQFRTRAERTARAIGGFSLGGLSAFDIAWNHELHFGYVGCFSASFWWSATPFDARHPDSGRIIPDRIRMAVRAADLRYFFMAGGAEETSDRNGNGIIDVVDDTLDVIAALREQGVTGRNIVYRYVEDGRHDQDTWGPVLIDWLKQLFR